MKTNQINLISSKQKGRPLVLGLQANLLRVLQQDLFASMLDAKSQELERLISRKEKICDVCIGIVKTKIERALHDFQRLKTYVSSLINERNVSGS